MVALRELTVRVQLQHALSHTQNAIGQRVPNWTTYANPWTKRERRYTLQTVAGAATRIQATVYQMRKVDGVVGGQQLVDGSQTFVVAGISDMPPPDVGFIEVQVA